MSLRYYRRTGPNTAVSNGPFIELVRSMWTIFIVLVFISSILGVLEGDMGYLPLALAMAAGGWWGAKRRL
jgi:hypothetical protein